MKSWKHLGSNVMINRGSKAISGVLPGVQLKRHTLVSGNERENVYYNIKTKSVISRDDSMPKIIFPEDSPVNNMKKKAVGRLQEEQHVVHYEIDKEMEKEAHSWNINYIKLLFEREKKIASEVNKYTDGLTAIYEKEMGKLVKGQERHNSSDILEQDILNEIEKFKKC